jgi:hypothetical protein
LYLAALLNHLALCELFLDLGAQVTAKDECGELVCPLEGAVIGAYRRQPSKEYPVVDMLLRKGASCVDEADGTSHPALARLIQGRHLGLVDRLLSHGGDINGHSVERDREAAELLAETPHILAAGIGEQRLVEWVLARGTDINPETDGEIYPKR